MEIKFADDKVKQQCTSLKAATKLFGGNKSMAISLHARINTIVAADIIKDIIVAPQLHFHNLQGKMQGEFAIDVKTRRDKWRIVLCPLDENEEIYDPCHIDQIATIVKIVKIMEVSAHYE